MGSINFLLANSLFLVLLLIIVIVVMLRANGHSKEKKSIGEDIQKIKTQISIE